MFHHLCEGLSLSSICDAVVHQNLVKQNIVGISCSSDKRPSHHQTS